MEHFHSLLRLRASLDTSPDNYTYYLIYGHVYANIPGQPAKKLFTVGGVNKARMVKKADDKYMLNTKEVVFYTDDVTGEVLTKWRNPFTEEENEVFQIYNDPVNIPLFSSFVTPPLKVHDGNLVVHSLEVPLCYPNPLQPDTYPKYSTGNSYLAAESFVTWSWKDQSYSDVDSAPALMSWTRAGPWMPWMKMGDIKGNMVFAAHSWKVASLSEFPRDLHEGIEKMFPEFFDDPQPFETKNQTTSTYFKEELDRRRSKGEAEVKLDPIGENRLCLSNVLQKDNAEEFLRQGNFQFNVSGKANSVGSPGRRAPVALQGTVKVFTEVTDSGVDVCVDFDLVDTKSISDASGVSQTTQTIEQHSIKETVKGTLNTSDINSILYNDLRTADFSVKNADKTTMSHVYLVYPNEQKGDVCLTANMILPWPEWMGPVPNDGYCVINVAG